MPQELIALGYCGRAVVDIVKIFTFWLITGIAVRVWGDFLREEVTYSLFFT